MILRKNIRSNTIKIEFYLFLSFDMKKEQERKIFAKEKQDFPFMMFVKKKKL